MERVRAFWARIVDDIHRNPGLWLGVGISVVIAIIAYLAYRHNGNSQQAQVPANGYGYPDYSALGSGAGSSGGGGYSGYAGAAPGLPVTPTGPSVFPSVNDLAATPALAAPSFPSFTLTAPSLPYVPAPIAGGVSDPARRGAIVSRASAAPAYVVQGSIQNPLAPAQAAHRATSVVAAPPTAIRPAYIPTTLQPATSGHGRAA